MCRFLPRKCFLSRYHGHQQVEHGGQDYYWVIRVQIESRLAPSDLKARTSPNPESCVLRCPSVSGPARRSEGQIASEGSALFSPYNENIQSPDFCLPPSRVSKHKLQDGQEHSYKRQKSCAHIRSYGKSKAPRENPATYAMISEHNLKNAGNRLGSRFLYLKLL